MSKRHLEGGVTGMNRIRELLRFKEQKLSQREISRAIGVARSTVQEYLVLAEACGLTHEASCKLSDSELKELLGRRTPGRRNEIEDPDWEVIHKDLHSRKGVTLELLWQEWLKQVSSGYSYSVFCRRYKRWSAAKNVVMRNAYRGGEFGLCDYAGETLCWYDTNGQAHKAEIFVGVLGASNYTYAEAVESQQLFNWLGSNTRFLEFIGGTPQALVIDNLKSGVTRGCRYEPELNRTFEDFACHYNTAVIATRAAKPRDKAKVEKAVQEVERWILAPLRNIRFHSIGEINEAIKPLLQQLNTKTMAAYNASRRELFEKLDQPALRALPQERYQAARWKHATVGLDYHVQIEHHYYSAPYWLARKQVWVRVSEHLVELYHDNKRLCSHRFSAVPNAFSTIEAHLPPNHLAVRSQTPEAFIAWSRTIGNQTEELVRNLLENASHKALAYRSILGLQRLAKKFGHSALEAAATVAIERRVYSQRFVRTVLEEEAFGVKRQTESRHLHANIRGSDYFH